MLPSICYQKLDFVFKSVPQHNSKAYGRWFFTKLGIKFNDMSEIFFADIIRHIVVGVIPTN
jgi:hypothetical protein